METKMATEKVDGRKNNRPPVGTRFKPGKSGNPSGRPKSSSINIDDILSGEAARLIRATDAKGRKVHLTKAEATAHQVVNAALKGDNKAISTVLDLASRLKAAGAFEELRIILLRWIVPNPAERGDSNDATDLRGQHGS